MKQILTFLLVFILVESWAQPQNLPLNSEYNGRFEKYLYNKSSDFHTNSKPYRFDQLKNYAPEADSLISSLNYKGNSRFLKAISNNNLLKLGGEKFSFSLNPIFGFVGYSGGFSEIKGGVSADIAIINKIHFHFDYAQGNSLFPTFFQNEINRIGVVPGQGMANFQNNGKVAYQDASGYISFSPSKHFNMQAGFGRNFMGDGYRSLLISDAAYSYPYLKLTTNIWKFQYVNLFTNLKDVRANIANGSDYINKYSVAHYLSWNVSKNINISLFESIYFKSRDTSNAFSYDINYLNPVIFYRPVEFSLGSEDNALLGLSGKITFLKKQVFYGQFVLDEFLLENVRGDIRKAMNKNYEGRYGWWANKYAIQAGVKLFDLGLKNLNLQIEYNQVRPYMYSHGNPLSNAGHFNQSMAHPIGANFFETLAILRYYIKNFYFQYKVVNMIYGEDEYSVRFGRDIYQSYRDRPKNYYNFIGQGVVTRILHQDVKVGYLLNNRNNLSIELGYINRKTENYYYPNQSSMIYFGLKSNIYNHYNDF